MTQIHFLVIWSLWQIQFSNFSSNFAWNIWTKCQFYHPLRPKICNYDLRFRKNVQTLKRTCGIYVNWHKQTRTLRLWLLVFWHWFARPQRIRKNCSFSFLMFKLANRIGSLLATRELCTTALTKHDTKSAEHADHAVSEACHAWITTRAHL